MNGEFEVPDDYMVPVDLVLPPEAYWQAKAQAYERLVGSIKIALDDIRQAFEVLSYGESASGLDEAMPQNAAEPIGLGFPGPLG